MFLFYNNSVAVVAAGCGDLGDLGCCGWVALLIARWEIYRRIIWRGIEAVITGLTRNQFVRKHARVRIPPSPPSEIPHRLSVYAGFLYLKYSNGRSILDVRKCRRA